jgi:hypothetical protein
MHLLALFSVCVHTCTFTRYLAAVFNYRRHTKLRSLSFSQGCGRGDNCRQGYDAESLDELFPTFRENLQRSSSSFFGILTHENKRH